MGTGNNYWNANAKAVLDRNNVHANWASGSWWLNKVALINAAFDIYYTARTNINQCTDAGQRSKMIEELEDAATDGWGSGVMDLDDAFEHMVRHHDHWYDNNVDNYYYGPGKIFRGNGHFIQEGPESGVNFLKSVDKKMAKLKNIFSKYEEQSKTLKQHYENREWERAGNLLEEINSYASKAKPFLWWAPRAQSVTGSIVSFSGALSDMHTAITTYEQSLRAGFPANTAASLVALQYAMKFVPVLGSFYGKLVGAIPSFANWYKGLLDDYFRRIDRATRAY